MLRLPETRFQAFSIHLLLSFVLFVILAAIIYWLWYPSYLFLSGGGLQGIYILMGVDLTIGPVLTLILYRRTKPGIKFDMLVILIFQMLCVMGGMGTLWYSKPLAIVYDGGTFYSPTRLDFLLEEGESLSGKLSQFGAPEWYSIDRSNKEAIIQSVAATYFGGGSHLATDLYISYRETLENLPRSGLSFELLKQEEEVPKFLMDSLQKRPDFDRLRGYPFYTTFHAGKLIVDTKTGEVVTHYVVE